MGASASPWRHTDDSTEATSRPRRSVTLAVLAANGFQWFLLPPLEELFTGKSITNSLEIERARFASLQQDVKHLHNVLNREQDELDLLALARVIKTQARHIADFNAALVDFVVHHRLAPPLLTPSVVQKVWVGDVPGGDRDGRVPVRPRDGLLGCGFVARGDRGDALRGAAPPAPRRGFCLLRAAGFPAHFAVRSDFSTYAYVPTIKIVRL